MMRNRLYHYVGPDLIRVRAAGTQGGRRFGALEDLNRWVSDNLSEAIPGGLIPATYVIDSEGNLRLADRRSEHIACSEGQPVLSAGEMFFATVVGEAEVAEVSNLSTGFCPEPESWDTVGAALDRIGVRHPGRFTSPYLFRRCPQCGGRNLVKDEVFECLVCGGELPREWNFV